MSRDRTRGGRRASYVAAVVIVALVVVAIGGTGTGAFTTGSVDRGSSIAVATDENGVVALDVNESVPVNSTARLLTVTNNLGLSVDVTVTLHDDVRDDADLVDGTPVGDSTTITLGAGEQRTIEVRVSENATAGSTLGFDVSATGDTVSVSAPDRSTTLTT